MRYKITDNKNGVRELTNPQGVVIGLSVVNHTVDYLADMLEKETAPLHEALVTTQAALEASQLALAEAKQEVARLKPAMEKVYLLSSNAHMALFRKLAAEALGIVTEGSNEALASPSPKFKVGDKVSKYDGEVGTIAEVKDIGNYFLYGLRYDSGHLGVVVWEENELAPYQPEPDFDEIYRQSIEDSQADK